jgi:hypothetical protein
MSGDQVHGISGRRGCLRHERRYPEKLDQGGQEKYSSLCFHNKCVDLSVIGLGCCLPGCDQRSFSPRTNGVHEWLETDSDFFKKMHHGLMIVSPNPNSGVGFQLDARGKLSGSGEMSLWSASGGPF